MTEEIEWRGLGHLRSEGEKLHRALARAIYDVRAGLDTAPALAALYDRFAWIPTRDTFDALRREHDRALLPEQKEAIARLTEWVASCIEDAAARPLGDRLLATETTLSSVVRGERILHHALTARVTNAADRALRIELYAALEGHWRALSPLCADVLAAGREAVRGLGLGEYTVARGALAGFDVAALAASAEGFLARTDDLYHDAVAELARRSPVGVPFRQLALHDLWTLFRLRAHDGVFHAADLRVRCLGAVERMGIDPTASGRIRFDLEDRPAKNPRACCVGLRVPEEVVVVCKPRGGADDYRSFLHELGHALHRASTSSALPFEDRVLGDASVTEGWATVLERLAGSRPFLERVLRVSHREAEIPARELATVDLFVARRHAAKLSVELGHAAGAPNAPERYAEALSRACAVQLGGARWAVDVDASFYSARYLRAWALEAVVFEHLRERFDEDWFLNPRTGPFLAGLWSLGQSRDADALAKDVFGATLDLDRLVGRFEARLA